MLPTHRPLRPSPPSNSEPSVRGAVQLCFSKPSLRWISLCAVLTVALYFVAALVSWPPPVPHLKGPPRHFKPPHFLPSRPPPHKQPGPKTIWSQRANDVRNAFYHAYSGYHNHAAPYDELLPVSSGKVNNFNGWGVTLFDALDTLWIMGFDKEFESAIGVVAKTDFALAEGSYAPFFETVIRYLGGLLSAYALSNQPVLLSRADDLGRMLLPALDTTSGFPMYAVNTKTGKTRTGWTGGVLWAEALSNQMEYKYLAHLTGRTDYYHKVEHIMDAMYTANTTNGLFPTLWDVSKGTPKNKHYSVGAFADSAHEYLLKQWLLSGQSEPKIRDLYIKSVAGIIDNLLYLSPTRQLLYVTDVRDNMPTQKFEHLSCFLPGLLALGVHTLALPAQTREQHAWVAEGLAHTCWLSYADQASGLGPDEMAMMPSVGDAKTTKWAVALTEWETAGRPEGVPPGVRSAKPAPAGERDYRSLKDTYLLRPETVESFYILWRTTGDVVWRERGWSVFKAIEKHARTSYGYASIIGVDSLPVKYKDEMPSYFLAETLKYLYLLFAEEDIVPLDQWVFNTEAHPLPVFNWSEWEREEYHIQ